MAIFNPYWKSKYDELITFYPRFYREVFEMDAILRAEGALADGIQSGIELVLNNTFVDTADEATIELLSNTFGVGISKDKSLEERRRIIKSYIAGFGKVSASFLKEQFSQITQADLDITFEPFDSEGNNCLNILLRADYGTEIAFSEIIALLGKWLPAHLKYMIRLSYDSQCNVFTGLASQILVTKTFIMNEIILDDLFVWLADENCEILADETGVILIE